MKKLTTLALAGAMAVSSLASASMSRWNGFGAANQFIGDVGDIWTLPAVTASNANATYFEFGATGSAAPGGGAYGHYIVPGQEWGGANGEIGPGVLAIWGNRPTNSFGNIDGGFTAPDFFSTGADAGTGFLAPSQQIDLIYGWNMSDSVALGVGVNRAVAGARVETVTTLATTVTDSNTSNIGVNLGADIKEVGPIALLEVGLQYNMGSATTLNNNGTVENKNNADGSAINVRVGGDIKGEKNKFQRVELVVGMQNVSYKTNPAVAVPALNFIESKNNATNYLLGWAMGMSGEKGMGLGGFTLTGLMQGRDEAYNGSEVNKFNKSSMSLNYVTAGEAKMKEWLTTRAGLSTTLFASNSTVTETGPAATTTKTTNSNPGTAATTISTGASLIFGDVSVDGVVNKDIYYNGLFLTSGIADGLFSQVSATWHWGNMPKAND